MTAHQKGEAAHGRRPLAVRTVVALLAALIVLAPALSASSGSAATSDPKNRVVSAPNVFFPVTGSRAVKDLRTYSRRHPGTDIKAPCGASVFATHPGTAQVFTNVKWAGRFLVRVISENGGLIASYGYMNRVVVTTGQILQAGQWIGTVGKAPRTSSCKLYLAINNGAVRYDPSWWLGRFVGQPAPISSMYGTRGFRLASMNLLGASHTPTARYGSYEGRLDKAMALWDSRGLDVIGTQEFQENTQFARFSARNATTGTWGSCYWDSRNANNPRAWDTENALLFRNSTMELVPWAAPAGMLPDWRQNTDETTGCKVFEIPYFNGATRRVPVALLKEKSSGRTAYFLNVHNASNVNGPAQQYRNQAIAIEKALIIKLRATGRPVFITGDFNDRQAAFCPLTANKLMISPNSIPSTACAYPRQSSIDWVFAAGQVRFSRFVRDSYPQDARISDHPIVVTTAHLQN